MTSDAQPSRLERWRGLAVAAVALAAYAPSMGNLYTLDDDLIVSSRRSRQYAPLSTLLSRDYFSRYNQDTYRPVATLTSMVDHRLGINPMHAGHAQNILWHAAAAALVATLAGRMLPPAGALVAGLVFAVHPAASEPVVSLGYREDAVATVFVLAALLLTLRERRRDRILALVAYALALFAKESAIVLPALLLIARLTVARRGPLATRALARELAAFGLVTVGYLAVRFGAMASPESFADPAGGSYARTLMVVPHIFAHYLRLLIAPRPLVALYAHMFPMDRPLLSEVPWVALDLAFLLAGVRLARTNPPLGFGLLWFAVALTPVLHFAPMRVAAADRFVYLPLVGGAIAAGAVFTSAVAAAKHPLARRAAYAGGGVALLALLVVTEQRIPVWHDEFTLWRDTLRYNPRAYMGHNVMAMMFSSAGRTQEAIQAMEAALADCPRDSQFGRTRFCALYAARLGYTRLVGHDLPGARAAFNEALGFVPSYTPSFAGLGEVALADGDLAGARRYAALATSLSPAAPQVRALIDSLRSNIARAEREGASTPPP